MTLQETRLFGCLWLRSRIRDSNKLSGAEQRSTALGPVSVHHSLQVWCINPQALIGTKSWNWRNSRRTCVWTEQDFLLSITRSDLFFAVSAYGTGKEDQKSSGLSSAFLRSQAGCDGHRRTGKLWTKCSLNAFLIKLFVDACLILSIWSW